MQKFNRHLREPRRVFPGCLYAMKTIEDPKPARAWHQLVGILQYLEGDHRQPFALKDAEEIAEHKLHIATLEATGHRSWPSLSCGFRHCRRRTCPFEACLRPLRHLGLRSAPRWRRPATPATPPRPTSTTSSRAPTSQSSSTPSRSTSSTATRSTRRRWATSSTSLLGSRAACPSRA